MYRSSVSALIVVAGISMSPIRLRAEGGANLRVTRSTSTGRIIFVTSADGKPISINTNAAAPASPREFLLQLGHHFGITDVDRELRLTQTQQDVLGHTHTKFQQIQGGVRVFGGAIRSHQNHRGELISLNGEFLPVSPKLLTQPRLDRAAIEHVIKNALGLSPSFDHFELVIVDPGWYGDRPQGEHLAYFVLASNPSESVAEGYFIDAHSGRIMDRWNLMETVLSRRIHNANFTSSVPGPVARSEGQGPDEEFEVNRAYDYAGDTYDFYWRGFGRDGPTDQGSQMVATVNSLATSCPNAFWNGLQAVFCGGLTLDDVVGHEFTHGVVEHSAGLIYQNQPGQLNESFADVFGELVDLFNGDVSLPGPPAGPNWPAHPTGPGTDIGNDLRENCVGGVRLDVLSPEPIATSYSAGPANFGPPLDETGISGDLAAAEPAVACTPIENSLAGKIALVDRGMCTFDTKALFAQQAGAIGMIVANNREGPLPFLSGQDSGVLIPSIGILQSEGETLRAGMESGTVVVRMVANGGAGVRWLIAEDGFGGEFRDMWRPSCLGDPDHANHPFQTCNPADNGGVHSGSGIPNHAFVLVTDGGTFNGYTIAAIGPIKAGAVWYRALTVYLDEIADFEDAFAAFNQAALDLVGTFPLDPRTGFPSNSLFTTNDAAQVSLALQAVEMNTPGLCGSFETVLNPDPFESCALRAILYRDGFENSVIDWEVSNSGPPTPYNWVVRTGLPWGMGGSAWFIADPPIGDCQTSGESAVHSLYSPTLFIWDEASEFYLAFTHLVSTEPAFDGGNVKISVNDGPFELIPLEAFRYNAYNAAIPDSSENPLAGQPAFTGRGAEWGTSHVRISDFVHTNDVVQFRFDFGKDACGGHDGWYISDLSLYSCVPEGDGDFDHDEKVTLADVGHFQMCFQTAVRDGGPCSPGDFDGNGIVDIRDFGPMVKLLDDP